MSIKNVKLPTIQSWPARLAFIFAVLCICLVIAEVTERFLPGDESLLILLSGTVLVSLMAGFLAGSFVAIVSVLGQNHLFQSPHGFLGINSSADVFELVLFFVAAFFLGWVGSQLRRSHALAQSAKAEAEQASRAREDLLAIVSHDLRNPLSAIRLNAGLLKRLPEIDSSDRAKKMIGTIARSTDRASRLIQDLLDVEKTHSGRLSVDPHPTSSRQILNELNEMMAPIAHNKLLELTVHSPEPPLTLHCDKDRLVQALANLLGNAIKFTAEGGKIEVGCIESKERVRFFVRDNGPGILPEHRAHLFDRYWQAAHTARMGTGLGLAITKGIVEAHHGRIWVESILGEGSTFIFEIPINATSIGLTRIEVNQMSTTLRSQSKPRG